MQRVPCLIIRGGTSKGVYLERDVLPPAGPERDAALMKLMGSPDVRQIDGLGGADKLTSKVAVMGPPTRPDCDVDYHFAQVMIERPGVDWNSNCGNLTAGAAVYGVYRQYVPATGERVRLAIHQVNTGRRLVATVPVHEGLPATEGDFEIGGVPGTGARIDVDFADFAGCTLGRGILPTGRPRDTYAVPGLGRIEVSVVDMANLCFFVRAADVGLDDVRDVVTLQADPEVVGRLEAIRAVVAEDLGYITGPDAAEVLRIRMNPLLFVVGAPRTYHNLNQEIIAAERTNLFARSITRALFSKAYPGSGSIATGVGSAIEGTITAETATGVDPAAGPYTLNIGHPSGVLEFRGRVRREGGGWIVDEAAIGRTGRVLMDGVALLRR